MNFLEACEGNVEDTLSPNETSLAPEALDTLSTFMEPFHLMDLPIILHSEVTITAKPVDAPVVISISSKYTL